MKNMKFYIRTFLLGTITMIALFVFVPRAQAIVSINQDPQDKPTLRVGNLNDPCANCWYPETTANPGDTISFEFYYHNSGSETANNMRLHLSPQTTSRGNVFTFNGSISANGASTVGNSVKVTVNGNPQTISFIPQSVRWYPNNNPNPTLTNYSPLASGQSGYELFSNGLYVGNINPGWSSAGILILRYKVSNDAVVPPPAQSQCSDGIDNDGDGKIDMADPGCSNPSDTSEYDSVAGNISFVRTDGPNNITDECATFRGYVQASGNTSYNYWFQYGDNPNNLRFNTNSDTENGTTNVSDYTCSLDSDTEYWVRLIARDNQTGQTRFGNIVRFVTDNVIIDSNNPPHAVTTIASAGSTSARLYGIVTSEGKIPQSAWFEYGTSNSLGSSTPERDLGITTSINVNDSISGLVPNTTYYFRIVARNDEGISRGNILTFRTASIAITPTPSVVQRVVVSGGGGSVGSAPLIALDIEPRFPQGRVGDAVDYAVKWKNISTKTLSKVTLRVQLPTSVIFRSSTAGTFSPNENIITLPIGTLAPNQEGVMYIQGELGPQARNQELVVATAIIVYSVTPGIPEEAIDYGIIQMYTTAVGNYGAAALFGFGFLPNTLVGWLLLLLLLLLLILIARSLMGKRTIKRTTTTTTTPFNAPSEHHQHGGDIH